MLVVSQKLTRGADAGGPAAEEGWVAHLKEAGTLQWSSDQSERCEVSTESPPDLRHARVPHESGELLLSRAKPRWSRRRIAAPDPFRVKSD